jgi:hypothetical protein
MKIGILTLPSSFNYGGILQALAMQRTLDTLGYDNTIIRRERPIATMDKLSLARKCKNLVKKILGKPIYTIPTEEQKLVVEAECRKFIEANMRKTCQVAYNTEELEKLCRENAFDTIVVGSDQVWRPHMTANIKNYFLDFCKKDMYFNTDEIDLLYMFASNIDCIYPNQQENNAKVVMENIQVLQKELRERMQKERKLYSSCSVLLGLMVCVLLF